MQPPPGRFIPVLDLPLEFAWLAAEVWPRFRAWKQRLGLSCLLHNGVESDHRRVFLWLAAKEM